VGNVARVPRFALLVVITLLMAGCSTGDGRQLADPDPDLTRVTTTAPTASGEASRGGPAPNEAITVSSTGPDGLTVSSPAFAAGETMPIEHTCDGIDRHPGVSWVGNANDIDMALVVRDADGDGRVHYLVTDLSSASSTLDGSATDIGTPQRNDFGVTRWSGPCPDDDLDHRYVFALYQLPAPLDVPAGATPADIVAEIETVHTGASTVLATYTRL
jgi:phosphatidylethanolamine-binding protein (PEBP) family uncharacterized protein